MLPLPKGAVWQLFFLFCAVLFINGVRSDGRVVCYYTNWSVYRPGTAKFNPQNINPYLCTHLIYAFGGFTKDNQMKPFDKFQDIEQGGYAKFTGLKTYNKQLKTMIAIGGWNEASSRFSPLVANPERRQKFIKNILKFLRQNHFDGIDLDWEYPAHREGGKPRDRDNYAQFVQELRAEFERESEKTGRPRLLVTMAVPAGIEYIEKGYDIPKLNKYLDWFNVLTYDFHSSHEPSVNHHAPLHSLEEESEYNYDAELNIDYSIKFYLNAGADRDKLVLGIPTYGRSYTLINEESTEIGAPAEAPGEQGDATREKGYLAYYEICQNIKEDPEWTVVQPNPNAMGPYAYRRNQWVGYDDEAIVRKKAQYVVDNGLGGIMFWAIDNDDFRGICTGKPYPLIEAAKDAMLDALGLGINEVSKPSVPHKPSRSRSRENSSSTRNRITTSEHKLTYAERKGSSKRTQTLQQTTRSRQQSTTTSAPTSIKLTEAEGSSLYIGGRTTTPPPPTTPDPGTDFKCEEEGFFQHPRDCKKYYWCLDSGPSGLGIVAHQFTCPSGLYFNPAADSCDFARNVPCKIKKSTTAAPITSPATTVITTARPTSSYGRITVATSRATTFFRTTPRTTTTTEAAEEDIEYEEDDEEDDVNPPSPFAKPKGFDKDSEEDPKVIKELIELIRKVGGIDELEKHLLRKDDGTISIKENSSSSSSLLTATTPSSISKSLYEKVLSKPNALNSFRNRFTSTSSFRTTKNQIKAHEKSEEDDGDTHGTDSKTSGAVAGFSKYSSVLRANSRQGPQSEGLDKLSDFDGLLKEKKQYITITRNRGTQQTFHNEAEDDISSKTSTQSHEDDEIFEINVKSTGRPLAASSLAYSTIRRTRPTTTTERNPEEQEDKEVTERKSYSSLSRSRVKSITTTELPEVTESSIGSTRYKYLERSRPTRPTTESSNNFADDEEDGDDIESENQENTVHFKAVNIEYTPDTQQEITTNTQRAYASIGRRTTTSTAAIPETEISTSPATTTITTSTPTISTKETPLTIPLTVLETTTPDSILLTTNIPPTTPTNPATTTLTSKTTTTTLPNGEDVLKSLPTTPNSNEINSDISETIELAQRINSHLTNSFFSNSNSSPTTESGQDNNDQENDNQLTTTETTLSSTKTTTTTAIIDSDKVTKTEDTEQEEVNLVNKKRNKTLYNTRTRTIAISPKTSTTTVHVDIQTTPSPTITTNAKKTLGVRRQQILLNRSSQTKDTSSATTTDIPTTSTTESVNNDFLGTVSSPRPFGFPKRRRPLGTAGITTTTAINEDILKSNDETLITKQKTTKLNAGANGQTKVSSQNTISTQIATKTSSQEDEIQQTESEVTTIEHLNSKDTKNENFRKHEHVVNQVDGIELNNDSVKHVINNLNLDSNNHTTLEISTHTSEHREDNNNNGETQEHKTIYSWHDARQPTKPTSETIHTVTAETIKKLKVNQTDSSDHFTIDNVVDINKKDSIFSKKQSDIVKFTGKYRGKSLENSIGSNDLEERNNVNDEDEGRAFRTYTTINRRREHTRLSTETQDEGISKGDSKITEVVESDQENVDESAKPKLSYASIKTAQTSKLGSDEVENNISQERGEAHQSKIKYTNLNRSSNSSGGNDHNENGEGDNLTISRFIYTKITRGQNPQTVDKDGKSIRSETADAEETNSSEEHSKSEFIHKTINRISTNSMGLQSNNDTKESNNSNETQSQTTFKYSKINALKEDTNESQVNDNSTKKYKHQSLSSVQTAENSSDHTQTDEIRDNSKHYDILNRSGVVQQSTHNETEEKTSDENSSHNYKNYDTLNINRLFKTDSNHETKEETSDENSTGGTKHYSVLNRSRGSQQNSNHKAEEETSDENATVNSKHYAILNINRFFQQNSSHENEEELLNVRTKIEAERKAALTRNKTTDNTSENIPYKAVVRDSTGVHFTEERLSGFVKNSGNSDASKAKQSAYQTISRGGDILQNKGDKERRDEHLKINAMASSSLTVNGNVTKSQEKKLEAEKPDDVAPVTDNFNETIVSFTEIFTNHYDKAESQASIITTQETTPTTASSTDKDVLTSLEEATIETTVTTSTLPETTTIKSLFENHNSNETISKTSGTKKLETNTKQQDGNTTQAEHKRIVFRKRPTSVTSQETVNLKENIEKVSEENTESLLTTYRTRNGYRTRPTIKKNVNEEQDETAAGFISENQDKKYENRKFVISKKRRPGDKDKELVDNSESVSDTDLKSSSRKNTVSSIATKIVENESLNKNLNEEFTRKQSYKPKFSLGNNIRRRPATPTHTDNKTEDKEKLKNHSNKQEISFANETVNGRRRTIIRKRIQPLKTSGSAAILASETTDSSVQLQDSLHLLKKQNNTETESASKSIQTINANNYLGRKNAFANRRITATQRDTENIQTTKETEEKPNTLSNKIFSNSLLKAQSTNSLNTRKSSYSSRRGSHNTRSQNNHKKTEEVEILDDGSKRIKTILIDTINIGGNKIKTIKKTKIKTITKQTVEYEDEVDNNSATLTTRKPILLNRGPARFQSNDLSSLLALDLASKANGNFGGESHLFKSRRKFIRKPPTIKEEEFVEEFIEEIPTSTVVTTEITKHVSEEERPLKLNKITENLKLKEGIKQENFEVTTRRTFNFKRPTGSRREITTSKVTKDEPEQEVESATRHYFDIQMHEDKPAKSKSFSFKQPIASVHTTSATEDIAKVTLTQNKVDTKDQTTTTEAIENDTSESVTLDTEAAEKIIGTTHITDSQSSLDILQSRLTHAVENLKHQTEQVTKAEITDAFEMKDEITTAISNGQDISLPIYHRRKYYQYYKDSPITYISPVVATSKNLPNSKVEANIDVAKQIHNVFNVSLDHMQPEPELSDEAVVQKAMEQAQEINAELSHFLLKTPGSN